MRGITLDGQVLTGQLVAALRRGDNGLAFTNADIEHFKSLGSRLMPDALNGWLRELGVLAVTLRDHIHATRAARQIERELIDPLAGVLDRITRIRA